ncbi:hypothetical protein QFZ65_002597 [Arthrobacter sp. B3I9]|uniref:hypothetical protein n=1 Tax=Arthrobacter sp. B3I9 TaxID=3042270 RepID=UPI0027916321|nr:hypothetical protein [Arthrobacter sp. B3I9]MDQ0850659.1 hypothetical protein [Arthrobacter sp. B3I9]
MIHRKITDWSVLPGASVEIRQQGVTICNGHVDTVTEDGKILWLQQTPAGRRLFEKAESYEAWATEESCGFHYKVTTDAGFEAP